MNSLPITLTSFDRSQLETALRCLDRLKPGRKADPAVVAELRDVGMPFLAHAIVRNTNPIPIRSVFRVAVKRLEATSMLFESPYLDLEYWDSYAHVYSRAFKNFDRSCGRLHFFKGPSGNEGSLCKGILDGGTEADVAGLGFEYVGFAVLRPTVSYNVGRVALRFSEDPEEDKGVPRCKGSSPQQANLMGAALKVKAVPFVQQDVVTGMCATASCWSAAQVLANRHDLHKFPYLEITRRAFAEAGDREEPQIPPERGLNLDQIRKALAETGAHPEVILPASKLFADEHDPRIGTMVREALYGFVESHIPVVVLLERRGRNGGLHAVCAIGHKQHHYASVSEVSRASTCGLFPELPANHFLVSEIVSQFYVHDDAYGPYNRLRFLSESEHAALNEKCDEEEAIGRKKGKKMAAGSRSRKFRAPITLVGREGEHLDVVGLVAPVPPYVRNRPEVATRHAVDTLRSMKLPVLDAEGTTVLWRTILTKGSTFKQTLKDRDYCDATRAAYATVHMPKYIWVCEFSICPSEEQDRYVAASDYRPIHGEFIYDTSTPLFDVNPIVYRIGPYFILPPRKGHRLADATWLPQKCFVEPDSGGQ